MADTKKKLAVDSVIVTVTGRLGGDPDVRTTASGKRISNASIAVGQRKKNAAGHWEDGDTMWFRLVCFGSDLDDLEKGDKVTATGRLTMSKWEDRSGEERTSYEILMGERDKVKLLSKPKAKRDTEVDQDDEYPES